ncbi:MAG: GNAT family N-acetyltransferase [Burkholderiaceae bacterium]
MRGIATYPFPQALENPRIASEIESGRSASFFLSRHWLRCCAQSWPAVPVRQLLEIPAPDGSVAYAVIGQRSERRHGFVKSRLLLLNESGDPGFDETFIELNGFYGGQPRYFGVQLDHLVEYLSAQTHWDELRLGGLLPEQAEDAYHVARKRGLGLHLLSERPSFSVDLSRVRAVNQGDYLATRTANMRQQVKRARRAVEQAFGAARVESARDVAQGLEWFERCGDLHRLRWVASRPGQVYGGFDNPSFVAFHRTLIEANLDKGRIEMLRLSAGDRVLAYLYNFVLDGHVYFYLSGIDYGDDVTRFKPGILCHVLAIERALQAGHACYDLLAGDARYKASLATDVTTQSWLILQRPRLSLIAERAGRRMKNWLIDRKENIAPGSLCSGPGQASGYVACATSINGTSQSIRCL